MAKRPEWILESSSFTRISALASEIEAWLKFSDCKLIVRLRSEEEFEQLENELESCRTLGRVKVERV
jgi:hypothetical protein